MIVKEYTKRSSILPYILIVGFLSPEMSLALCRENCMEHTKFPEHTHEERQGVYSYNLLSHQAASPSGTTTSTIRIPMKYVVKIPDSNV